jgi:hypothetical protein
VRIRSLSLCELFGVGAHPIDRQAIELVDAEKGLVIVRVEVGIDMPNTAQKKCAK